MPKLGNVRDVLTLALYLTFVTSLCVKITESRISCFNRNATMCPNSTTSITVSDDTADDGGAVTLSSSTQQCISGYCRCNKTYYLDFKLRQCIHKTIFMEDRNITKYAAMPTEYCRLKSDCVEGLECKNTACQCPQGCEFEKSTSSCNCGTENSSGLALVLIVSVFVGPLNIYLWYKCFRITWRDKKDRDELRKSEIQAIKDQLNQENRINANGPSNYGPPDIDRPVSSIGMPPPYAPIPLGPQHSLQPYGQQGLQPYGPLSPNAIPVNGSTTAPNVFSTYNLGFNTAPYPDSTLGGMAVNSSGVPFNGVQPYPLEEATPFQAGNIGLPPPPIYTVPIGTVNPPGPSLPPIYRHGDGALPPIVSTKKPDQQ